MVSIALLSIIYIFILINISYIKKNWNTTKCKSGIFIGGKQNFNECVKIVLSDVVDKSTQPLISGVSELQNFYKELSNQVSSSFSKGTSMNSKINDIARLVIQIISKLSIPLIIFLQTINTILLRIKAILVVMIYFILSSIMTLRQLLEMMLNAIINILIILAALILVMMILPFSWGVALTFLAVFTSISIPLVAVVAVISEAMNIHILKIPKIPKLRKPKLKLPHLCFDQSTIIPMNSYKYKYIHELNVGDILRDGTTIVTAVLKLDSTSTKMYSLNNILVTGSHLVKYNNTWIPVSSHPNSIYLPMYVSNTLYCINTTSGFIELGDLIFTDWDEMLPNDFIPYPINTVVYLEPNIPIKIQNVKIKDIIKFEHLPNLYIVTGIVILVYNQIPHYHLYTNDFF
jgi:hypothetical protein